MVIVKFRIYDNKFTYLQFWSMCPNRCPIWALLFIKHALTTLSTTSRSYSMASSTPSQMMSSTPSSTPSSTSTAILQYFYSLGLFTPAMQMASSWTERNCSTSWSAVPLEPFLSNGLEAIFNSFTRLRTTQWIFWKDIFAPRQRSINLKIPISTSASPSNQN